MSADTRPISPSRFAAALRDLSLDTLQRKVAEIRNSMAHLQYSNDQLRPFAAGTATATGAGDAPPASPVPDPDCVDAMRENEAVLARMAQRIALVRAEVERRGTSWALFHGAEPAPAPAPAPADVDVEPQVNGEPPRHAAWTDGTFQTGALRLGRVHLDGSPESAAAGGRLSDEQLRRDLDERRRGLLEERQRDLSSDLSSDGSGDGGIHL